MTTVRLSASIGSPHKWPNGRPIESESLPDGRVRHVMEDGRVMTVGEPHYRIDYLSTWVGARPDDTYTVNISIVGLSDVDGFYEAWNFDIGELRSYSFAKTVKATHIATGETFNSEEFQNGLRDAVAERG